MKNKVSKDLIIFMILIPLFLAASFFISSRLDKQLPEYSAINKSKKGYSVFYEALKELHYPIERSFNSVVANDVDTLQLIADEGNFDLSSEDVKDWIGRGGVLVYLTPEIYNDLPYGVQQKEGDNISHYQHRKGFIIVADINLLTNGTLMEDTSGAYLLLQEIQQYPYEKIYINEHYLYSVANKVSLWSQIPMAWKFLIYQVLLMLVGFFYYKGKAFGKPIPLHEEVERIENEYLYASASLYRQAKSWDLMLEIYYNNFLKEIKSSHEGWLDYWKKEDMPHLKKAEKLYSFIHKEKGKVKEKEYMQMVMTLDQLRDALKKRRDTSWKIIKKPQ